MIKNQVKVIMYGIELDKFLLKNQITIFVKLFAKRDMSVVSVAGHKFSWGICVCTLSRSRA